MSSSDLIHRLSRIIGQLEGLKKTLQCDTDHDCLATIQQLKASINGLKKFGESYVKDHMKECVRQNKTSIDDMESMLSDIISGAFSL